MSGLLIAPTEDQVVPGGCQRPSVGWFCTRPAEHEGPCPTWPTSSLHEVQLEVTARAMLEARLLGTIEWDKASPAERAGYLTDAELVLERLREHAAGCVWVPLTGRGKKGALPMVECRHCGASGWMT